MLTTIAVGIGFLISFGLAIVAVRRRRTYGPILALSDVLYTIPSLALFAALISVTGISLLTVVIPLVMYTLVIFVRNIAAGFDSVSADVLEAADGLGYTSGQRLWRVEVPLAVPLIVAGVRLAAVSTIGLVTVTPSWATASAAWASSSSRATGAASRSSCTSARSLSILPRPARRLPADAARATD